MWWWCGAVDEEGENFDCASILSSHTQDVKCVHWHPTEEVWTSAVQFLIFFGDTAKGYSLTRFFCDMCSSY